MIVGLEVPEKRLVTIPPRVILASDVLVRVFNAILKRGHMVPVIPVLFPEVIGIERTKRQARYNHVESYLPPEVTRNGGLAFDVSSLAVELVVLCPGGETSHGMVAVEAALNQRTDQTVAQTLRGTLGYTEDIALKGHGGQSNG